MTHASHSHPASGDPAGDRTPAGAIRVRFAPSPTGRLHLGNVRTALFNYLYARRHGGAFVLRVDDTDRRRNVASATDTLMRDLRGLGLDWDEGPDVGGAYGPYVQSARAALYAAHLERLLADGHAYRCYCTPDRLAALAAERAASGLPPRYDRRCLTLSAAERATLAGSPSVVRLRLPDEAGTFHDAVFGERHYDLRHADDPILTRSDGSVLYDLASIVDDHLMGITHILRGDTWLATTPVHIALFRALGWEPPIFGHLPNIVGTDRRKLAKRDGATSLGALLEGGYLPEAIANFLALLGWSPGAEGDVLTLDDLCARFDLDRVGRSPAVFDPARLSWLNGVHIRRLAPDDLARRCLPALRVAGLLPDTPLAAAEWERLVRAVALSQDRLRLLTDAPDLLAYVYRDPVPDPGALLGHASAATARALLAAARDALTASDFAAPALEAALRALAAARGCTTSQLFGLIRAAVTGRSAAPPLFAVLALLGRDPVLARIERAISALPPA